MTIESLRKLATFSFEGRNDNKLLEQAASELEALQKEVVELKQALEVKPITPAWEIAKLRTQNQELSGLLTKLREVAPRGNDTSSVSADDEFNDVMEQVDKALALKP